MVWDGIDSMDVGVVWDDDMGVWVESPKVIKASSVGVSQGMRYVGEGIKA